MENKSLAVAGTILVFLIAALTTGCASLNPKEPGDRFNAYLIAAEVNASIHLPPAAAAEVADKFRDAKLIYAQNSAPSQ